MKGYVIYKPNFWGKGWKDMKIYLRLISLVSALMIATTIVAPAATYNVEDGLVYVTEADAFITNLDNTVSGNLYNQFNQVDIPTERLSVMVRKVNASNASSNVIKGTTYIKENQWFAAPDNVSDETTALGEIVYINEYAPENDTSFSGNKATGAFSEGLKVKEALTPGRYALFLGTSADLQEGTHQSNELQYFNGVSPDSEDNETPIYVEYFNVYDDGSSKSIGLRWKDKKTGDEMRALQAGSSGQKCPAASDEYHIAFIADIHGFEQGDEFGILFSYTDTNINKVLKVYCPFDPKSTTTIEGGAAMRFGVEVCGVPAEFINSFKAEGYIGDGEGSNNPIPSQEPDTGRETKIYVSKTGSDNNDGSSTGSSVASISKAKKLAADAATKTNENVIVEIASGNYYITSPITFDSSDTSDNQQIIFRGASDKSTVISGGEEVTGWSGPDSNGIYTATISASNIRELYVNDEPQTRAKTTHNESSPTEGKFVATSADRTGIKIPTSSLPSNISDWGGAEVVCNTLWTEQRGVIKSVSSSEGVTTLAMEDPWSTYYDDTSGGVNLTNIADESSNAAHKNYFYVENVKSQLDTPGEFFFDKSKKTVYYMPEPGTDMSAAKCYVGVSEGLLRINGTQSNPVKNITFKYITFEHGTWLEPNSQSVFFGQAEKLRDAVDGKFYDDMVRPQIEIDNASGITFDGVVVKNIGSSGISARDYASNITIKNSDFMNIGASAISIGHPYYDSNHGKIDLNLLTKEVDITNNYIKNTGWSYAGSPGAIVYQAKNVDITGNTILDCTYSGLSIGWGWGSPIYTNENAGGHNIKRNYIDNAMTLVDDGATIYTLGQFPKGVTIESNYCGNIDGVIGIGWHGGIYCDEGSSNVTIKSNVVVNGYRWLYARGGVGAMNVPLSNIKVDGNYSKIDTDTTYRTDSKGNKIYFIDQDPDNVTVTNHSTDYESAAANAIKNAAGIQR